MKQTLTILTLLCCTLTATAQNNSLLWRISGNGLSKPSFLFGTMHLICADDYVWTDKMKASLSSSEKVCFEMDMSDPNLMMQAMAGMIDKSGKKLPDYFTPEQYQQLSRYIKDSVGMDIAMFEQMKLIMLETLISSKSAPCTEPVSYEERIMKTAQDDGKKILGLEDVSEQIAALEHIPTDSVIKSLLDDINGAPQTDTDYIKLVAAYKLQDLPALYNLTTTSAMMEEERGPLLDERNQKWVARITDKMKGTSVFFAVGAAHLYGPKGEIELLRQKGYKVEPLK